jgi:magnesium-transporting ATPase (P-type)
MRKVSDDRTASPEAQDGGVDVEEAFDVLLRDLRTSREGLSSGEAQRRALQYGPNELRRREGISWPREVAAQLTQPLALLLWVAAGLEFAIGNSTVGIAVVLVIVINATMALFSERQAEQAVEALSAYLPQRTTGLRDGQPVTVDVSELVPGDVIVVAEGERVPADVRLIEGAVEIDMSALTGESQPVLRSTELVDVGVPRLEARDLAFMGATCTEGEAQLGMHARGEHDRAGAGLSLRNAVVFAVGPRRGAVATGGGRAEPGRARGPQAVVADRGRRGGAGDRVRADLGVLGCWPDRCRRVCCR